jgi:hypothetical protein
MSQFLSASGVKSYVSCYHKKNINSTYIANSSIFLIERNYDSLLHATSSSFQYYIDPELDIFSFQSRENWPVFAPSSRANPISFIQTDPVICSLEQGPVVLSDGVRIESLLKEMSHGIHEHITFDYRHEPIIFGRFSDIVGKEELQQEVFKFVDCFSSVQQPLTWPFGVDFQAFSPDIPEPMAGQAWSSHPSIAFNELWEQFKESSRLEHFIIDSRVYFIPVKQREAEEPSQQPSVSGTRKLYPTLTQQ